jgi:hypothetical protein
MLVQWPTRMKLLAGLSKAEIEVVMMVWKNKNQIRNRNLF